MPFMQSSPLIIPCLHDVGPRISRDFGLAFGTGWKRSPGEFIAEDADLRAAVHRQAYVSHCFAASSSTTTTILCSYFLTCRTIFLNMLVVVPADVSEQCSAAAGVPVVSRRVAVLKETAGIVVLMAASRSSKNLIPTRRKPLLLYELLFAYPLSLEP